MLNNEQIEISTKVREKWNNDIEFVTLCADIKDSDKHIQQYMEDRITEMNRNKIKADGNEFKNKAEEDGRRPISESQKAFCTEQMEERKRLEAAWMTHQAALIKKHPCYRYLDGVAGCGPAISGSILASIDLLKIDYVSQIYSFCGVVTGKDKLIKGQKATFNKHMKSRLLGVLADSFMMTKSEYSLYFYQKYIQLLNLDWYKIQKGDMLDKFEYYDKESGKMITNEGGLPLRKKPIHMMRMAKRDMIQHFLLDYYKAGRTILGMPIIDGYMEAHAGLVHHETGNELVDWNLMIDHNSKEKKDAYKAMRAKTKTQIEIYREQIANLKVKYGLANIPEEDDTSSDE